MCFPPMNKDFIEELFLFASDFRFKQFFSLGGKDFFSVLVRVAYPSCAPTHPTLIFNNMDTVVRMGKKGR